MSDKALLVMDIPEKGCISCVIGRNHSIPLETCIYCPLACRNAIDKEAEIQPDWCPLKPIPEKIPLSLDMLNSFEDGWNACIDKIMEGADTQYTNVGKWIPEDNPPKPEEYILLSFDNFSVPLVGMYREDDGGGAYYVGDDDESCSSQGLFVNAWMPIPEPYRKE